MAQTGQSLEFKNLPLLEAVVRVYFSDRIQVDYRLVNELHRQLLESQFREDFPNVATLSLWEVSPALKQETQLPIPRGDLPGAEYTGGNRRLSVHLQPQLLAVRWRRGPTEHGPAYPRYDALRKVLEFSFAYLQRFQDTRSLEAAIINMAYRNFIRIDDPRPYLVEKYSTRATIGAKTLQEQIVAWEAKNGIDLRFEVRGAEQRDDNHKKAGYLLTTAAGRKLEGDNDPMSYLDEVHDALQVLFSDLISERAKDEWEFQR